jgi:hypothetical protein
VQATDLQHLQLIIYSLAQFYWLVHNNMKCSCVSRLHLKITYLAFFLSYSSHSLIQKANSWHTIDMNGGSLVMLDLLASAFVLNICDIDFFNFCHCQVRNFKILNHFERDQNVVANFQKHWKWNQKLPKYITIEWNLSKMK